MVREEPTNTRLQNNLQPVIVEAVRNILIHERRKFLLFERFGFDIAVFVQRRSETAVRLLEVKVFAGSRPAGIGFGGQKGQGLQVERLATPTSHLDLLDATVGWVYTDATKAHGSERYALFRPSVAKAATMGGVVREKRHNLRISELRDYLVSWTRLCEQLEEFLVA